MMYCFIESSLIHFKGNLKLGFKIPFSSDVAEMRAAQPQHEGISLSRLDQWSLHFGC